MSPKRKTLHSPQVLSTKPVYLVRQSQALAETNGCCMENTEGTHARYLLTEGGHCYPSFRTGKPRAPQLTLDQLFLKRIRGGENESLGVPTKFGSGKQAVGLLANTCVPVSPVTTKHAKSLPGRTNKGEGWRGSN